MKPLIIEKFTDNGEFSHYELIDSENGELLWTEDNDNNFSTIKMSGFMIRSDKDSLKIQHMSNDKSIRIAPKTDNSCVIYASY
jgi:hypothetical protein